ncbi:hypothetical protein FGO68_gene2926 [Halteria grandinella]|uniref:VWFA domain-containing protein n=1 Tax=Halteria grandinella TaxID=5974 RepID=A0A8J8NP30_HALGN|nr:hypothetical protein FGO68_gene2926 [Halteria grandinella]
MDKLTSFIPDGGKRNVGEAVAMGYQKLRQVGSIFNSQDCRFVHVAVSCGGADIIQQLLQTSRIKELCSEIPQGKLSSHFVNMGGTQSQQLLQIAQAAQGEYIDTGYQAMQSVFNGILTKVGMIERVNAVTPEEEAFLKKEKTAFTYWNERPKFIIMLTIESSGSMTRLEWNSITQAVQILVNAMQPGDLISCLLFNSQALYCITDPLAQRKQELKSQLSLNQMGMVEAHQINTTETGWSEQSMEHVKERVNQRNEKTLMMILGLLSILAEILLIAAFKEGYNQKCYAIGTSDHPLDHYIPGSVNMAPRAMVLLILWIIEYALLFTRSIIGLIKRFDTFIRLFRINFLVVLILILVNLWLLQFDHNGRVCTQYFESSAGRQSEINLGYAIVSMFFALVSSIGLIVATISLIFQHFALNCCLYTCRICAYCCAHSEGH